MKKKRRTKGQKRLSKNEDNLGGVFSQKQLQILDLFFNKFYTAKQIINRLGISYSYVYKTIRKGRQNPAWKMQGQKGGGSIVPIGGAIPLNRHPIRLHGCQFRILILWKDRKYKRIMKDRGDSFDLDGETIKLNKKSVEIYSHKSFFGNSPEQSFRFAMDFYNKFIRRLEDHLKIILIKPNAISIKLCKYHIAEVGNELAKDVEKKGEGIKIFARDDGKLWFKIDNSFNLHEAEWLHPGTALEDSEKCLKHFNDWRINDPPTNSELSVLLKEVLKANKETAAGLNCVVQVLKSLLPDHKEGSSLDPKIKKPDYIG